MAVHFEIYRGKDDGWYWRLRGSNNKIMANGEGYRTRWGAKRGANRFAVVVNNAQIIVK